LSQLFDISQTDHMLQLHPTQNQHAVIKERVKQTQSFHLWWIWNHYHRPSSSKAEATFLHR